MKQDNKKTVCKTGKTLSGVHGSEIYRWVEAVPV